MSGVSRRSSKPLKKIDFNEFTDPTALKRARNTAAARKSRAKKLEDRDHLVFENEILRDTNKTLTEENSRLNQLVTRLRHGTS